MVPTVCGPCRTDVLSWPRTVAERSISSVSIETIKDGFKLTPTAVTVIGTTVWVTEAKFAYLNDPKLKDQNPGPFSAVAVPLPPH
jgi:hypothetical protein